jgi:hypothetical protein
MSNSRGERQLHHALDIVAIGQIRNGARRSSFAKRARARREALRALKRQISDAVY